VGVKRERKPFQITHSTILAYRSVGGGGGALREVMREVCTYSGNLSEHKDAGAFEGAVEKVRHVPLREESRVIIFVAQLKNHEKVGFEKVRSNYYRFETIKYRVADEPGVKNQASSINKVTGLVRT